MRSSSSRKGGVDRIHTGLGNHPDYTGVQYLRSLSVQPILDADRVPVPPDWIIKFLADSTRAAEHWQRNDRVLFICGNNIFGAALRGINVFYLQPLTPQAEAGWRNLMDYCGGVKNLVAIPVGYTTTTCQPAFHEGPVEGIVSHALIGNGRTFMTKADYRDDERMRHYPEETASTEGMMFEIMSLQDMDHKYHALKVRYAVCQLDWNQMIDAAISMTSMCPGDGYVFHHSPRTQGVDMDESTDDNQSQEDEGSSSDSA
jgi:hypothetical protein